MVGGRSYNQSQFNRAIDARRQPGSVFKPFVYLAAFERAARRRAHRPDAGVADASTSRRRSTFDDQVWEPKNYDDYDGEITWRRALAMSRNLGTIHVGEQIGFDTRRRAVAAGRRRHAAARLPVDHARRVRADAARSRAGLHAVHQRRRACGRCSAIERIEAGATRAARRRRRAEARSRGPTRRSSSPT